jgi:hypothetical protein
MVVGGRLVLVDSGLQIGQSMVVAADGVVPGVVEDPMCPESEHGRLPARVAQPEIG